MSEAKQQTLDDGKVMTLLETSGGLDVTDHNADHTTAYVHQIKSIVLTPIDSVGTGRYRELIITRTDGKTVWLKLFAKNEVDLKI